MLVPESSRKTIKVFPKHNGGSFIVTVVVHRLCVVVVVDAVDDPPSSSLSICSPWCSYVKKKNTYIVKQSILQHKGGDKAMLRMC